jgi:hypothetical protein
MGDEFRFNSYVSSLYHIVRRNRKIAFGSRSGILAGYHPEMACYAADLTFLEAIYPILQYNQWVDRIRWWEIGIFLKHAGLPIRQMISNCVSFPEYPSWRRNERE